MRMKNRLFLIIPAFVALGSMMLSCSQDYELDMPDADHKAAISFNVDVGSNPVLAETTRGASNDATAAGYTFVSGDQICIAVTGDGTSSSRSTTEATGLYTVAAGDAGSTGSALALTYAGSVATDAFIWLSTAETVNIRAWSWGNDDTTTDDPDGNEFTIESTQSGTSVKELLYAPSTSYTYTDTNTDGTPDAVNVSLYHQMARIVVNITSTITTSVTISSVQIGHTDYTVPLSGTFTKPSSGNFGTWTVGSTTGVITAKAETATSGYLATYSAVVIPADNTTYAAGDKLIVVTTSNGTYYYTIPTGGYTFEPGYQYTFNITNLNQIDFNVTVSEWGTGTSAEFTFDS